MTTTKSMTFYDGFTARIGDEVTVSTKYGTGGRGKVIGFDLDRSKVKVDLDPTVTVYGKFDRWPLKTGGFFDRARDHGIAGGEIVREMADA
jgi:hypothetical protein